MRRAVLGCLAVFGALALATSALTSADAAATPLQQAQYRLNQFGCDAGPMNGKSSDHTKDAIIRFQAANQLTQTGNLNDVTRAKLVLPTAIACNARPVPEGTGTGKRIVVSQKQNWIWLVRKDGSISGQGGMIDNPGIVRVGTYSTGSKCGRPAKILH